MYHSKRHLAKTLFLGLLALGLTACGNKQAFVPAQLTASAQTAGTFEIPPKVDVLLVTDESGSMLPIQNEIRAQFPSFLERLESSKWDYHFASVPLVTVKDITQVAASRFDANWVNLGQWIPPYPGAPSNPLPYGTVNPSFFRPLQTFSDWTQASGSSSLEYGLQKLIQNLGKTALRYTSGFLRSDAMLAVVLVGNGEDISGVNYCYEFNGAAVPCEQVCTPTEYQTNPKCKPHTSESSFQSYLSQLSNYKNNMRMYSAVSNSTSCRGAGARVGSRYKRMAESLGGKSYNICNQNISTITADIATDLDIQREAYVSQYLFADVEPEPSSIRVVVRRNDGSVQELSMNPNNGFTYEGYVNNVPVIIEPTPMNYRSGWGIRLHGSARLVGYDQADVTYREKGTSNSN